MKSFFHALPVNVPFEDPSVYIRMMREKRALLFDLGYIGRIETGNLLKVTDAFVTHTHIDHFIGFDTILRAILMRDTPLNIFGPENVIQSVEGKLKGYTWNLIKDYPLKIEVFGVSGETISHASFYAANGFERADNPEMIFDGTLINNPVFKVRGLMLMHQIPVMAYTLEEEFHININKAALIEMELPVGPWLSKFKMAIRENHPPETTFEIGGRAFSMEKLMHIAMITKGQKISYVMDISPTDENVEKVIPFVKDSDILFCEAYFLERDRERAIERHHLTAALAGRIAREANAANLTIMHFSPKYRHCVDELYQEAMREFKGATDCQSRCV
ncbi:hypothetical protein M1N10_01710 [Thermodesulfovibrionales bacterium]|nr:hypothetical protein [Thermodesulfovibrionales bacterium]